MVLSGSTADRCAVRVSPLAELCACLHALNDHGHHPDSRSFARSARAALSHDLDAEMREWAPMWGSRRARFLFPFEPGPGLGAERGLDAELAAVSRLALDSFAAMAAAAIVDGKTPSAVRATFIEQARRMSPERLALAERLVDDPEELRGRLVAFLSRFGGRVFEPEWRRVAPVLREDADRRRRELDRDGLAAIARITPTAKEAHDPHRVVFDKLYDATARLRDDPCVLLPSAHGGPHVTIKHVRGRPIAIQYPVGSRRETSFEDVDRRIRALADPSRVRICREVLRGRRTTVDLAQYTKMAEPQVSRHLRRLREAGLVRTSREGRMVYYELDAEALKSIGQDLFDALWR